MQKAGEVLKTMEIGKAPIEPGRIIEAPSEPPKGLVTKLCEVMAAVKRIPKSGYNSFHNFYYATEGDLVEAIRDELATRHVLIFPDVIDLKRTPHEYETNKGIRKTQLTEIVVRWTFVDGDTGEAREVSIPGVGEDNNDKGFYKAFTGSEKYMLMKTFLVATGDDPEAESKGDAYDAKEKAKRVAADKLRSKAEETKDETMLVTEWGTDGKLLSLSGGGLAIVRAEMEPEKAKALGIRPDRKNPWVYYIPTSNIFKLEDFAKEIKPKPVLLKWTEKAKEVAMDAPPEEHA